MQHSYRDNRDPRATISIDEFSFQLLLTLPVRSCAHISSATLRKVSGCGWSGVDCGVRARKMLNPGSKRLAFVIDEVTKRAQQKIHE